MYQQKIKEIYTKVINNIKDKAKKVNDNFIKDFSKKMSNGIKECFKTISNNGFSKKVSGSAKDWSKKIGSNDYFQKINNGVKDCSKKISNNNYVKRIINSFKNNYSITKKHFKTSFGKAGNIPWVSKFMEKTCDFARKTWSKRIFRYALSSLVVTVGMSGTIYVVNNVPIFASKQETKIVITDNKAEDYFYQGEYTKAIAEYSRIYDNDKENGWWYVKIAEVYSVKGEMPNSTKYIELSKKLAGADKNSSRKSQILNYIIFTEVMNKDYKTALTDGQAALREFPNNKNIIKTMFTVYMANGRSTDSSNLISNYPVDTKSAYDMAEYARMLMMVGRWDEGITHLKSAWDIDRDEYKIYDVLSQTYNYNKDTLLDKITNLSETKSSEPAYKMWLAKIYSMSPDTSDQAEQLLKSISSKDSGIIEAKLIQAAIYENKKDTENADKLINTVIIQRPNDYRVLHTAGWYYLSKKDYAKALQYCQKSILKNKDYPDNYGFLMPEILKAEGKGVEGEPYFRIALSKEPYNYNLMLNIANYYANNVQNFDKAMEYYDFAQIIKPSDADIKYAVAQTYLNANKTKEAIGFLEQCTKISPSTPKFHRTLGVVLMLSGKTEDGYNEIHYAYQADENDILTLNDAGCYYITVKQDLQRGLYNLQKAYEGINSSTDSYTKTKITENYKAAVKLNDKFNSGKSNENIKVPDFTLFY